MQFTTNVWVHAVLYRRVHQFCLLANKFLIILLVKLLVLLNVCMYLQSTVCFFVTA